MKNSSYQEAIYEQKDFQFNLQIQAVAGSGKTTTLTNFAKLLPGTNANVAVAFNKGIAEDFGTKFPSNTQCSTLHSLGFNLIRQNSRRVTTNDRKVENILKYKIMDFNPKTKKFPNKSDQNTFWDIRKDLCKIVSLFKGRGITDSSEIPTLIDSLSAMYQVDKVEQSLVQEVYNLSLQQEGVIDFDDMILFPVVNRYEFPHFDNVFVDEAQDLNIVQQKFIQKLANSKGRVIVAGDTFQAIYGFRGASPESMNEFHMMFNPVELPLSICYRCSKAVVREAKRLVKQIEAWEDSPEGVVDQIIPTTMYASIQEGDFILSRFNAPLVKHYLTLKKQGKNVKIKGAKIVQTLVDMMDDIKAKLSSCDSKTVIQYREYITSKERMKVYKKAYLLNVLDIVEQFLIEEPDTSKVRDTIIRAFSDATDGIILSSIHGVKGLEAKRVFLVSPEDLPSPRAVLPWEIQQEINLKYVAITRAKEEFYYVTTS